MSNGKKLSITDSRWVFKRKIDANDKENFKARLVIRGFKDENWYKLRESYAPVSRFPLVRTVISIINKYNFETCQLDVKTAFLNGVIDEENYMNLPEGLSCNKNYKKKKVCKLV